MFGGRKEGWREGRVRKRRRKMQGIRKGKTIEKGEILPTRMRKFITLENNNIYRI